jgi:integrase
VRGTLGLSDVRLHDFRRTFATHLYLATKDDYLVKRCINHTNPSVTAIYVRITQEEVTTALQAQVDQFFALQAAPVPLVLPAPAQRAVAPLAFC